MCQYQKMVHQKSTTIGTINQKNQKILQITETKHQTTIRRIEKQRHLKSRKHHSREKILTDKIPIEVPRAGEFLVGVNRRKARILQAPKEAPISNENFTD